MLYQTHLELEACKNEEPQEFKRNVGTMFQNPNSQDITIRLFTIRGNVKLKVDQLCKKSSPESQEQGLHSRLVRGLGARGPEFDSRISHPCFDSFPFRVAT